MLAGHADLVGSIASVFAAERCFDFSNTAEFESKAREVALAWVPRLPDAIVLIETIGGRARLALLTRDD